MKNIFYFLILNFTQLNICFGQYYSNNKYSQTNNLNSNSKTLDLFILAGQSNAQGTQGNANQLPIDNDDLDRKVRFNWTVFGQRSSNGWQSLQPQQGIFPSGHFGAEISLGRNLVKAGYNTAIFKFCRGGTSLHTDWKKPGENGIYDAMVTEYTRAINQLQKEGYTVRVRGFIWIQGESDSRNQTSANLYYSNLKILLNHLRGIVLKNNNIPTILAVDEQFPTMRQNPEVLLAHHRIESEEVQTKFVTMMGLRKADYTHLTPQGNIMLGNRIFDQLQCLISKRNCVNERNILINSTGILGIFNSKYFQNFISPSDGFIKSFSFSSNRTTNYPAAIKIIDGSSCQGRVIGEVTIKNITSGLNQIAFTTPIMVKSRNQYTLLIEGDPRGNFQVAFNSSNIYKGGNLRTYNGNKVISGCDRNLSGFDLAMDLKFHNFSQTIENNLIQNNAEIDDKNTTSILFPNPVNKNGEFTIQTSESNPTSFYIIDNKGQLISTNWKIISDSSNSLKVKINGFDSGIYKVKWGLNTYTLVVE